MSPRDSCQCPWHGGQCHCSFFVGGLTPCPQRPSPWLRPPGATPPTLLFPLSGNYFYVSTSAGPPHPPPAPSPPRGPPQEPPAGSPDPSGPLSHDVDLIFRTIEQLTVKLNRLKVSPKTREGTGVGGSQEPGGAPQCCAPPNCSNFVSVTLQAVERAHRELLRSLGRSSATDGPPPGGGSGGAPQPPSPDGDSPLSRILRSLQGPAASVPGRTQPRPDLTPSPTFQTPPHPPLPPSPPLQAPGPLWPRTPLVTPTFSGGRGGGWGGGLVPP